MIERALGALVALYLLIGRWTPGHSAQADGETPLLYQPRTWAAALIVGCAFVLGRNLRTAASSDAAARGTGARIGRFTCLSICLLAYLMLSAVWAPDPSLAVETACELFLVMLVMLALWKSLVDGSPKEVRQGFWLAIVCLAGFMAILGLSSEAVDSRVSVLGGGPNVFGRNMGLLACGCLFFREHPLAVLRWFFVSLLGVAVLLVVVSGSRGALTSTVLALAVWWRSSRHTPSARVWIVVLGLVTGIWLFAYTEFGDRARGIFEARISQITLAERDSSGRDEIFSDALRDGLEHPVLGLGTSGFLALHAPHYPHNFFLELFAEGGGVGLLLGALAIGEFVRRWFVESDGMQAATLASFVLVLAAAQFSGNMYDSRAVFLLGMLALLPAGRNAVVPKRVAMNRRPAALPPGLVKKQGCSIP